jgi:hypothetical protein
MSCVICDAIRRDATLDPPEVDATKNLGGKFKLANALTRPANLPHKLETRSAILRGVAEVVRHFSFRAGHPARIVKGLVMPIHLAGKDQTHPIPSVLRKLSCHVLVTRAAVIHCARDARGGNTVWHKVAVTLAPARWPGTKMSATGRLMEVGWVQYL